LQPSPTSAVYNAHGKTKVGLKRKLSEEERVRQLVRETIKYACFLLLIDVFGIIFFQLSYKTGVVILLPKNGIRNPLQIKLSVSLLIAVAFVLRVQVQSG
jgi:hypothetical protein